MEKGFRKGKGNWKGQSGPSACLYKLNAHKEYKYLQDTDSIPM
jgi:hypothetical protein